VALTHNCVELPERTPDPCVTRTNHEDERLCATGSAENHASRADSTAYVGYVEAELGLRQRQSKLVEADSCDRFGDRRILWLGGRCAQERLATAVVPCDQHADRRYLLAHVVCWSG